MQYRHTSADTNYEDLASGSVLRSAPGFPGFPVRLASELFSLGRDDLSLNRPLVLYDPFCGSGQLVSGLGFLHQPQLAHIVGSDVSEEAVRLASQNLALLGADGLRERVASLQSMHTEFGKDSHARAILAAGRLGQLPGQEPKVTTGAADALDAVQVRQLLGPTKVDLVISDLPYGDQTTWSGSQDRPVDTLLDVLGAALPADAVVVLVGRGRKLPGGSGQSYRTLRIGTRVACFYRI